MSHICPTWSPMIKQQGPKVKMVELKQHSDKHQVKFTFQVCPFCHFIIPFVFCLYEGNVKVCRNIVKSAMGFNHWCCANAIKRCLSPHGRKWGLSNINPFVDIKTVGSGGKQR